MRATHYGTNYQGGRMGCGGTYASSDPTIAAVGPSYQYRWPCETRLRITGPAGEIIVTRQDYCPGCEDHGSPPMIDLSERGNALVCGAPLYHTCQVTVEAIE